MNKKDINSRLFAASAQKGVLIASHRGVSGGNIVENTIGAYKAAINTGADIIEMDVPVTLDGKLVCIHDGMESRLFRYNHMFTPMLPEFVARARRYMNTCKNRLNQRINRFDDVLEALKYKCIINVDRCWGHWHKVFEAVRRHGMEDQVIFKCGPTKRYLEILQNQDTPFMFMPIVKRPEHYDMVKKYDINVVAYELVFATTDNPIISPDILAKIKDEGCLLWGNAIDIREGGDLGAGYDDYVSLTDDPEKGWGKLLEMGFDIIQTDFPAPLCNFLIKKGARKA